MKIKTDIKVDTVLPNGVYYLKDVVLKAIEEYNKKETKLGQFGKPLTYENNLNNISIYVDYNE